MGLRQEEMCYCSNHWSRRVWGNNYCISSNGLYNDDNAIQIYPVGVCTQDEKLRKKFSTPDKFTVIYFYYKK